MRSEYDKLVKVVTVGDACSQKSALLRKLCDQESPYILPTIGIDLKITHFSHENERIKFQIWDTAGQEKFRDISQAHYKGAHAILWVYDVTDRRSFINIQQEFERGEIAGKAHYLIGNTCNLNANRAILSEDAQQYADENKIDFIEVSTNQNLNVAEIFAPLLNQLNSPEYLQIQMAERQLLPLKAMSLLVNLAKLERDSSFIVLAYLNSYSDQVLKSVSDSLLDSQTKLVITNLQQHPRQNRQSIFKLASEAKEKLGADSYYVKAIESSKMKGDSDDKSNDKLAAPSPAT